MTELIKLFLAKLSDVKVRYVSSGVLFQIFVKLQVLILILYSYSIISYS